MTTLPPLLVALVVALASTPASFAPAHSALTPPVAAPHVPAQGPAAASVAARSTVAPAKPVWRPTLGASWQLQYSGAIAPTSAAVIDLDGEATTKAQVAALHAEGKSVICYFSAGSYESWRRDHTRFPSKVIGKPLPGWPGERWLDIRNLATLLPIMNRRLNQCRDKGFDAVDPDNMDGYANAPTGFGLKKSHALRYLKALSSAAHARGLAIGLKNALALLPKATPAVEFAVNEQCLQYHECGVYARFVATGRPVFQVEYTGSIQSICAARPVGFSTVRKHLNLDAWAQYC